MSDLVLYLGNKNYSSWSLRAWLALRHTGAPFREEIFVLSEPGVRDAIRGHSPAGKVPFLRDGDLVVWDSLAICEYVAERFPEARLWPGDPDARAVARSVSAEMHSSFSDLRQNMPMNVRRSSPGKGRAAGVERDIARILEIWRDCRGRFGSGGDFLFGSFTIADCMYAPVVSRFTTYAVDLDETGRAYSEAIRSLPAMQAWCAASEKEATVEPAYDL